MKQDLRSALASGAVLVSDGGMGTSLYEKGFHINRSFEELCVTNPAAVREVTEGFKHSGSQLLTTNTFSASIPKLTEFGLQDQLETILKAAVGITREVAGDSAWTLGSMGPLGLVLEPLGRVSVKEAEDYFAQTAKIFHDEGVDGFALETFSDLNELGAAIRGIRRHSDRPVFAFLTLQDNFRTSYGHSIPEFVQTVESNVDVLGLNCHLGPSELLEALEILRPLTQKPVAVMPNAGLPRFVNNRYIYMCNPDYLGKFTKRFILAGANIVGGCCGTSAAHIRAIANAVRMAKSPGSSISVSSPKEIPRSAEERDSKESAHPTQLGNRSLLGEKLQSKKPILSVELVPPKGIEVEAFLKHCRALKDAGIQFVNIPDGARAVSRMGSLHLASFVKREVGLEPIPHFTSRDRNLLGIQADLLGSHVNGVRNILLVTGDPPKLGNCPDATAVYDVDAIGLTHIVSRMNRGSDLGGSSIGRTTQFVVGVALNPTSTNPDLERQRFQYKIEAGADFAITQPIYDLAAYDEFFQSTSFNIPIIMGIWPLVSLRNAEFLKYEVPGVSVPDWVIREMERAGDSKDDAFKRGLEISARTISEAGSRVAGFQISAPFNKIDIVLELVKTAVTRG